MKNKKIILLIVLCALVLFYFNVDFIVEKYNQSYYAKAKTYENFINLYEDLFYETYKFNGKLLKDCEFIDENDRTVMLKDYLNQDLNLIVVYSEYACNICSDSLYSALRMFGKRIENANIITIAYSQDKAHIKRLKKINRLPGIFLVDNEGKFMKQNKIKYVPSLLVVNNEGRIINSLFFSPSEKHKIAMFYKAFFDDIN